jgi:hypothetical protein
MTNRNDFRIETPKHGNARVWLNGVELHCIVSVDTAVGIDKANRVTIEFIADSINAPQGGPIPAGKTYLVGETGMEIQQPREIDVTGAQSDSREYVKVDG